MFANNNRFMCGFACVIQGYNSVRMAPLLGSLGSTLFQLLGICGQHIFRKGSQLLRTNCEDSLCYVFRNFLRNQFLQRMSKLFICFALFFCISFLIFLGVDYSKVSKHVLRIKAIFFVDFIWLSIIYDVRSKGTFPLGFREECQVLLLTSLFDFRIKIGINMLATTIWFQEKCPRKKCPPENCPLENCPP